MEVRAFESVHPDVDKAAIELLCDMCKMLGDKCEGKVSVRPFGEVLVVGLGYPGQDHRELLDWAVRQAGCGEPSGPPSGSFFRPLLAGGELSGQAQVWGVSRSLKAGIPPEYLLLVKGVIERRIRDFLAGSGA